MWPLLLTVAPSHLCFPGCTIQKFTIEKLEKELVDLKGETKRVEAVQKLKHKQIAMLLQTVADIQATVDEVTNVFTPCCLNGAGAWSSPCIAVVLVNPTRTRHLAKTSHPAARLLSAHILV